MKELIKIVNAFIAMFLLLGALMIALNYGTMKSVDNQNEMLCNSAKVSGNKQYLTLCEVYYETGDITYIRKNHE